MGHLSGKEKATLAVVLWLVVVAGVALGIIFPLYLRLQDFPDLYRASQQHLEELEMRIKKFAEVKREYERIAVNVPRVESLLLDQKQAVSFIELMEGMARTNALYKEIQLESEPGAAAGSSDALSFVFRLTLIGRFEDVMRFIAHMESAAFAADVEKTSLALTGTAQTYGGGRGADTASFRPAPGDVAASITIRVHAAL